jgi:hypothetical protein
MKSQSVLRRSTLSTVVASCALVISAGASAGSKPNYDELLTRGASKKTAVSNVPNARVVHTDERLGVPSMVWVAKPKPAAGGPASLRAAQAPFANLTPSSAATAQMQSLAPIFGGRALPGGEIIAPSNRMANRPSVVKLKQEVAGVEVFRGTVSMMLDRDNNLTAVTGHLVDSKQAAGLQFKRTQAEAIAAAYADLTGQRLDSRLLAQTAGPSGRYTHYQVVPYAKPLPVGLRIPARVKPVLYELPEGLIAAHYVEVDAGSDYYSYVIADSDGRVLFRKNLQNDATAYTYQAWADATAPYQPFQDPSGNVADPFPAGQPITWTPAPIQPNLITLVDLPHGAPGQVDPWLPDNATVTTGNNVDAYADLLAPQGFSPGDIRGQVTSPGVFNHGYNFSLLPYANTDQIQAAVVHLFYINNWLHDWYYDSGFTEADGNAQTDNYGRGGIGGDPLLAEGQDYSGTDNSNMNTPSDGASPRMQMYIFTGTTASTLTVTIPPGSPANYTFSGAQFSPRNYDVQGTVVAAIDPADSTGPSTTDGCSTLTNAAAVAGNIALIDRGTCSFQSKVDLAQAAGAIGVIIADTNGDTNFPPAMGVDTSGNWALPNIPAVLVHYADGQTIRANLAKGITAHMSLTPVGDLDGTIDDQIIGHEWGHYISNRLVHDATGLTNTQARGMQEGWADFHALLLTAREEDALAVSNPNWSGTFPLAGYASQDVAPNAYYYGIRRVPYSTDFTKDPLTFQDITDGQPLPPTASYNFGADGSNNSEVHNTGEIWASMLWECYASLLRDTQGATPRFTFSEAQSLMKSVLLAAYKMTPAEPSFVDARDAVLAAAYAADATTFQEFAAAFARRGIGIGAVAPPLDSPNNGPVVESYVTGPDVEFVSATLADDVRSCDNDGYLDDGEIGTLRITLRATGTAPLTATTVTVTADNAGISFPNGGTMAFPTVALFDSATVQVPVTLHGVAAHTLVHFTFSYNDANGVTPGQKTATAFAMVQADELPHTSATETVDSLSPPWAFTAQVGQVTFGIDESAPPQRTFFGPDTGGVTDFALLSPPLHVGAGDFAFSFQHLFSFETDGSNNYDGGVVEISTDGGATWTDLGSKMVSGGYNGSIAQSDGTNPIAGRPGFVQSSFAFALKKVMTTQVDLGTAYAGQTVQVRFRIGTDQGGGAYGWDIDNIAFTGLADLPFTTLVDEQGDCPAGLVRAIPGASQSVNQGDVVTLNGGGTAQSGNPLTFLWQQLGGPQVALSNPFSAAPTFTAPAVTVATTLTFRLTVSDGTLTDKAQMQVTVAHVNQAPVAAAGAAQTVDEGSTVTLQGSGTDPDGDAIQSYAWTQVGGAAVTLSGAGTANPTFTAPALASGTATLTFQLVVGDGSLSSQAAAVTVTVRHVPHPPTLTAAGSQTVASGGAVTLSATATDPENGAITWQWTQTAGPAVTLSGGDTGRPSFTAPSVSAPTTLSFAVTATSSSGLSAQGTVSVTVTPGAVAQASSGCTSVDPSEIGALALGLFLAGGLRRARRRKQD